ncbi:amino acid adenylation domain-containing protein [Pseudomonas sp. MF6755]|uniref:amino acid adenylation domain-containing protein n=1 Tax=Pseudomonas sp. MF6755 TaxID=2797530 RepID=UPI0018E82A81|nr:amino acid adenylation domain-containing protein [Pseudomonas sp. MF6755]MBJ2286483.1 amino acid adenylation domain-containing protein [Pseudomonas sp. MF6755]
MTTNTVASLFSKQLSINPDNLAIVSSEESVTYADLDHRSSKVSAYLQSRNIGRGDYVLVQAERSIELIIALIAIVKRGAALVPVDRRLPQKRKEYIAKQCAASIILSTNSNDKSPLLSCEVKSIKELLHARDELPYQPVNILPEDAMYVIFTSGTTGNPKGVVIEHHSVAKLILQHNINLEITDSSRSTLMASVGFDLSQSEIWSALTAGGCIHLLDDESILNSTSFLKFCVANKITHAFIPTLKIYDILNTPHPEGLKLKYIYTCGEKLHPVEVTHLPYSLIDCYGPTEATIFVTSKVVESKRLKRPESIGHPIGDSKIYILDENLIERPAGEVGELCIAGSCLARGYLGAPELTAERFVYSEILKCRIYRSGDQGRLLEDGSIQFLGRMDGQVKVRGYRVELGEIEARLLKEPEVNSVAVVVEETDSQATKRLVAFIVKRNKDSHSERLISSLRRSLEADLPDYMLPEKYHCLEALPSNSNGKTDKPALLEILKNIPSASLNVEHFENELQKEIAYIWFELLKHGDFGLNDSFFDIGGHSLRAAELAKTLSFRLNIKVTVSDIYEHLIFKDLATELLSRTNYSETGSYTKPVAKFENDVTLLPDTVFFGDFDPNQITEPKNILLTGVTGFVGIHLLAQLLATSAAAVHCPVRCDSSASGLTRIQQISERYQVIIDERDWDRIHVYTADLPETNMGIEDEQYFLLVKAIDLVYHAASAVNFIMPYSYMKKDNVDGLKQIIKFCAFQKTKPLMLMSTISIYSWGHRYTKKTRVYEEDSIDENLPAIRDDLGYVQSKWVMEKITDLAASKGLPVMTFRLGYATCHSRTGVCAHYQWWGRFIQTCLTYNAIPALQNMREGLTTVDYMVETVAHISRDPKALGKKFNLCQDDRTNLDLQEFCNRVGDHYGRKFEVLPFRDWVKLWSDNQDSILYPLLGLFKDDMHNGESILELYQNNYSWDCSNVKNFLKGSNIHHSEFTYDVLHRYLEHLSK